MSVASAHDAESAWRKIEQILKKVTDNGKNKVRVLVYPSRPEDSAAGSGKYFVAEGVDFNEVACHDEEIEAVKDVLDLIIFFLEDCHDEGDLDINAWKNPADCSIARRFEAISDNSNAVGQQRINPPAHLMPYFDVFRDLTTDAADSGRLPTDADRTPAPVSKPPESAPRN